MSDELMARLSAAGWTLISTRTSPTGLTLYKRGRGRETSPLGRWWDETEERSVEGWQYEADQEAGQA